MVSIEITFEKHKEGDGVRTTIVGLPANWDDLGIDDKISDKELSELTPEQQFGVIAMNILDQAKPAICQALGRLESIRLTQYQ